MAETHPNCDPSTCALGAGNFILDQGFLLFTILSELLLGTVNFAVTLRRTLPVALALVALHQASQHVPQLWRTARASRSLRRSKFSNMQAEIQMLALHLESNSLTMTVLQNELKELQNVTIVRLRHAVELRNARLMAAERTNSDLRNELRDIRCIVDGQNAILAAVTQALGNERRQGRATSQRERSQPVQCAQPNNNASGSALSNRTR